MEAYKALRDVATRFGDHCRQVSEGLASVRREEPLDDVIAKKQRDVRLFTSKCKLLEAKSANVLKDPSQTCDRPNIEQTIHDFGDIVESKIIEQFVVKAVTQSHTVQNLLATSDLNLDQEFVEKKANIIESMIKYSENEKQLHILEGVLEKTENELLEVQRRWHQVVGKLRETPKEKRNEEQIDSDLRKRLQTCTKKSEQMRWLINTLVTSRYDSEYDWGTDSDQRLRALAVARRGSTAADF